MSYEDDVNIDPDAIDIELLDQPRRMQKYTDLTAKLQEDYDIAEQSVDIVRADLDEKIRSNPDEFTDGKLTETLIANIIAKHSDYVEAKLKLIKIKKELNSAKGAVRAFDHRKESLSNLVKLHGQQYFAGPSIQRDLSQEWEIKQRERQSDANAAKALRRQRENGNRRLRNAKLRRSR